MQILGLHPRATESKWWDGDSPIHGFMRLSVDPTAHSFWEPLDQRALVSRCHSGEKSAWKWRRHKRRELDAWVGKISWSRKWLSTPVFLPGKFPWTEEPGGLWSRVSTHTHTHTHTQIREKQDWRKRDHAGDWVNNLYKITQKITMWARGRHIRGMTNCYVCSREAGQLLKQAA